VRVALLATSTGIAVVYTVALFVVLIVAPLIVTALKRQWLLFVAGWLTIGLVWWIASLRLARPDSWWARRFYGEDKLARAQSRYGATASD
jgi:lysylphosphatidylglycerol synthetase-like protein (DUF2156 family)